MSCMRAFSSRSAAISAPASPCASFAATSSSDTRAACARSCDRSAGGSTPPKLPMLPTRLGALPPRNVCTV
eukprot:363378-Chlamydomonas_euryale.AAC.2